MIKNKGTTVFIKYVFFAGLATLVDISLSYLLTNIFNIFYFYSAILSYVCGGIVNFILNKKYFFFILEWTGLQNISIVMNFSK